MGVVPDHFYKQTYSNEQFEKLCAEFELPKSQRKEIRTALEDFAAIWRGHTPDQGMIRRPSKDIKALKRVSEKATKLLREIERLSLDAQSEMRVENSNAYTDSIFPEREYSKIGHKYFRYIDQDRLETTIIEEVPDLVRSVEIIKNLADAAAAKNRPAPTGRRHNMAMATWMANIVDLWTETLGRAFTRDATAKGEPLSKAAAFCVATFNPIDPKIPNSRVLYEMKKAIARERKSITGKNVVKNKVESGGLRCGLEVSSFAAVSPYWVGMT